MNGPVLSLVPAAQAVNFFGLSATNLSGQEEEDLDKIERVSRIQFLTLKFLTK